MGERKSDFAGAFIEALPTVEEIEALLSGNCHHGCAVTECQECSTGRIFEVTLARMAERDGATPAEAEVAAVAATVDVRTPRCSHIKGCTEPSRWTAAFRLQLSGAGEASGSYEGDIPGGLCRVHQADFAPLGWQPLVVKELCDAHGMTGVPPAATWSGEVTWTEIVPVQN